MPSLQTIAPNTRESPLEKALQGFSSQMRQNQVQQQDTDALSSIYKQFQNEEQNIAGIHRAIQTNPTLSPTARVNAMKENLEMAKHNAALQNAVQKQQADKAKADAKVEAANKEQQYKDAQIADMERRQNLAPGELSAYRNDPRLAQSVTKQPKENQADREVHPDQVRRMQHVEARPDFADASIDEKGRMYRDAGVSKENTDYQLKPLIEKAKIAAKEKANSPEAGFNKGVGEDARAYFNEAIKAKKEAREERFALDEVRKAIKGQVAGPGMQAIIKNNPYGQLMMGLTPDESLLQAANKKLLGSMSKGTFGTKPTEREIFLLLNSMLPSIGKTLEANEASLGFMDKVNAMKERHADLVTQLTEGGTKYVPGLEAKIEEMMEPAAQALKQELEEVNEKYNKPAGQKEAKNDGKILVTDPEGGRWRMTLDQLDNAAKQGVFFEPVEEPA